MKYLLLFIAIFFITLNAQYDWTNPVVISSGDFDAGPVIVKNLEGKLFTFWFEHVSSDVQNIAYSFSNDDGDTWNPPETLTPFNFTYWLHDIHAVVDINNMLHITFLCMNSSTVFYMKYDKGVWSNTEVLDIYSTGLIDMESDSAGRTYLFYMLGGDSEYFICKDIDGEWSDENLIPNSYFGLNFVVDGDDNLIGSGCKNVINENETASILKYHKKFDNWEFFDVSQGCIYDESRADNLCISDNGTVHIAIDDGISTTSDRTVYRAADINNLNNQTECELVKEEGSAWWKHIFVDQNNSIHLIESGDDGAITHSIRNNNWELYSVPHDSTFWYGDFDAIYDNNTIYLVYVKFFEIDYKQNPYLRSHMAFIKNEIETGIESGENLILGFTLEQNYPNPFNSDTYINYTIKNSSNVQIKIFNIKGEFIEDIVDRKCEKGKYTVMFDAENFNSGVYYYQLVVNNVSQETKRMLYLK